MNQLSNLKLQALAIGSLPHNTVESAMEVVKKDFSEIRQHTSAYKVSCAHQRKDFQAA